MPANIQVFSKKRATAAEPDPGSTRPGGGVGMDRKIEKPRFTPKRIGVGAAVLLLGGLFAYALLADFGVRKLNVDRDRLTISMVEFGPFQEYIPVRGTVLPLHTVYLDALERGQVEQVFVEEGASVAEGDPLLRLANPDLELTVLQQEAELERSREALRYGRLTMEQELLRSRKALMEIEYQLAINKRNFERYERLSTEDLTAILSRQEQERLRDEYQYSVRRMALTEETQTQDSLLAASKVVQLVSAVERMERNSGNRRPPARQSDGASPRARAANHAESGGRREQGDGCAPRPDRHDRRLQGARRHRRALHRPRGPGAARPVRQWRRAIQLGNPQGLSRGKGGPF